LAGIIARKEKMMGRRQFCYAIGAMLAGGAIPGGRLMRYTAIKMRETEPRLTTVIYDARIPASCAFARSVCRSGIAALESGGDVGALWHNAIVPGLRPATHQLMGLTLASDLFLLKLMAADAGMKKVWHEVAQGSRGSLVSWVIAGKAAARTNGSRCVRLCREEQVGG
jgi:hypothetical protein